MYNYFTNSFGVGVVVRDSKGNLCVSLAKPVAWAGWSNCWSLWYGIVFTGGARAYCLILFFYDLLQQLDCCRNFLMTQGESDHDWARLFSSGITS